MKLDFLIVRPGDPITADLWNKMRAANAARRILKGDGTLPHEHSMGTTINLDPGPTIGFAWQAIVSPTSATVGTGLVNGIEPTIKDVNSGRDTALSDLPLLAIDPGLFDDKGKGWIALQLTLDAAYTISKAEVVQAAVLENDTQKGIRTPGFSQGLKAFQTLAGSTVVRYPLVLLIKRADAIDYRQIAMFDLQYKAKQPGLDATGAVTASRHFFWPV